MRKVNGTSAYTIEFEGVERRDDVGGDAAHGHSLPRADDEIGERHHPSGGKADAPGKCSGGVSDFAAGIWHGCYEPAIDPADGQEQRTANRKPEQSAEGATAEQPVIHDHEPADPDHGAPREREVIG